jgi:hypothetical protein
LSPAPGRLQRAPGRVMSECAPHFA